MSFLGARTPPPQYDGAWMRLLVDVVNNAISGRTNNTGSVTLTASSTTTTLTDRRLSADSKVVFEPTTANAATARAALYVSAKASGSFTLTHASSANTDQTFDYVITG